MRAQSAEPEVNWEPLGLAVLATAPVLMLSLIFDDPHWLKAAVVSICALVAQQRTMLTPAGTLPQGLAILVGFTLLSFALLAPPVFVIGAALFAAATIGLSAWGDAAVGGHLHLHPALYLAFEDAPHLTVWQIAKSVGTTPCLAVSP